MKFRFNRIAILLAVFISLCFCTAMFTQNKQEPTKSPTTTPSVKGTAMPTVAKGTFEVKLNPLKPYDDTEGANVGRMSIDKQFHGDLEAVSKGEMLTGGSFASGSAGYVAIERVNGKLNGRTGTFIFQHTGSMERGKPSLSVTVIPDSGTGELVGLSGKLNIIIEGGKHFYEFEYTIEEKH